MEKLTKKQRKAIAFRERKGKRPEVVLDVPEQDEPVPELIPDKKRKRGEEPELTTQPLKKSKPTTTPDAQPSTEDTGTEGEKGKKKQRFILFVGNLSYTTTQSSVQSHFESCPDPPSVRLLTPKTPARPNAVSKSKGCAFLEFPNGRSLQAALKLHHTVLDGRTINVELTSGGGGGGAKRRETLKERNKALEAEREKKRQAKNSNDEAAPQTQVSRLPKRHSTTSGAEHQPPPQKTWSIPEGEEKAGRGGKKHAKKPAKSRRSTWASGANAVAVG